MILMTGGNGLLGKELQKHISCWAPSHEEMDICNDIAITKNGMISYKNKIKMHEPSCYQSPPPFLIIHCAAYTDLVKAEKEKELCYQTNVLGTRNLASLGIPMLYISTEYIFDGEKGNYAEEDYPNPRNFYAFTKLLGEYESRRTRSVVVRCLFKPRPFEHPAACTDQFTSGDYVDRIAGEIVRAIKGFDKLPPTLHIGTGIKSTFELAKETRDVTPITVDTIQTVKLPKNTSLNTTLWERIKEEHNL